MSKKGSPISFRPEKTDEERFDKLVANSPVSASLIARLAWAKTLDRIEKEGSIAFLFAVEQSTQSGEAA